MSSYAGRQRPPRSSADRGELARGPVPGKQTLVQQLALRAVQRTAEQTSDSAVHAAAARGTATAPSPLPFGSTIQRAFGRHDISGIQAHSGAEASASARDMGAGAYATGQHVVLGASADLHTVAHEAAHVVQQRGGVQLQGGVGQAGDPYERHADRVADAVVRGESAEALLDQHAGGGGGGGVQRVIRDARTKQPNPVDWDTMTRDEARRLLADIMSENLTADADDMANLHRLASVTAPDPNALKRKGGEPVPEPVTDPVPEPVTEPVTGPVTGPVTEPVIDHKKRRTDGAKDESAPAPDESAPPPGETRGTREVFETPPAYFARTGTTRLYRAVRMTEGTKKRVVGSGAVTDPHAASIPAQPDGGLFPGVGYGDRLDMYRALTEWPADRPITAVDPEAQADPLVQVSGGDRGTQFISTGANIKGAAHNTVRNWNATGLPDERPLRDPKLWAPVITIDVRRLGPENRVYDIQRPGVKYMYHQDALGMMANLSSGDAEVLLTGTIPADAIIEVISAPRALAEAAGVTVVELKKKFSDEILLAHGLIDPPAPAVDSDDDDEPAYVPLSRRRAQQSAPGGGGGGGRGRRRAFGL